MPLPHFLRKRALLWAPIAMLLLCACADDGVPDHSVQEAKPCTDTAQCLEGLYCEDAACHGYGRAGRLCLEGQCLNENFFCNGGGRCQLLPDLGESCDPASTPCRNQHECLQGKCTMVGALGEPCSNDGTCDPGLACVNDQCREPGVEGEPCLPNQSCLAALACIDNVCRPVGSASGQPCFADGTCREGLLCGAGHACVAEGQLDAPCTDACNDGLLCLDKVCSEPRAVGMLCQSSAECVTYCAMPLGGDSMVCVRQDPKPVDAPDGYPYCAGGLDACRDPACQNRCAKCENIAYYNGLYTQTYAVCQ